MRQVILDVDTGHDDAMAILLAARHLDVLGITTVAGNAPLEKTTKNTLKVLELAGLTHIPVAKGSSLPLVEKSRHAPQVHGPSGLDGYDLPEPTTPLDPRHAVEFIVDTVRAHEAVTLVPVGPLTNIAAALRQAPDIAARIAEISLMGGGLNQGNITATAEFNIYCDPEAAHIVFSSGAPIKMAGVNITEQSDALPAHVQRMRAMGNRTGAVAASLMDFYAARLKELSNRPGATQHDAVAVAWLIDPSLIEAQEMYVAVELTGALTRGMTVCDGRPGRRIGPPPEGRPPSNALVGLKLDTERFFELFLDTLATYP
ncbi:MAG: nucleoside hydrolase [Chloroflexota bacterium]